MNPKILFFIITGALTIIFWGLCLVHYKKIDSKLWREEPTIGNFLRHTYLTLLYGVMPVVNICGIIIVGGHLIWNKIKDVKI